MNPRRVIKIGLTGFVLMAGFLVIGIMGEPFLDVASVGIEKSNASLIEDLVQEDAALVYPETLGEFYITEGSLADDPAYIMVDVALDDEFLIHVDAKLENNVGRTLNAANTLLKEVGLNIKVASIQTWQSDDNSDYISARLTDAALQTQQTPGNLFLAISHQATAIHDGLARDSGSMVIVALDDGDEQRTSALIAHEVAHLLGAQHHEASEECQGYGCIMDGSGFAHLDSWCEHHIQQIRGSVASKIAAERERG